MPSQQQTPTKSQREDAVFAVLCSGNGSNFQALAEAVVAEELQASIALMVTDNPNAGALERAERLGIESRVIDRNEYASREAYEAAMIECCEARGVQWICLAGYMRILSPHFVKHYADRIVNVHPSLLPAFPGAHAVRDALRWGVKVTGVTVHLVNDAIDDGPILAQEPVSVMDGDTEEILLERVHEAEHRLYPQTLQQLFEGKLSFRSRHKR